MHKKFDSNRTKIKGGCQSGRKVITHDSKSDLPLVFPPQYKNSTRPIPSLRLMLGTEAKVDQCKSTRDVCKKKYKSNGGGGTKAFGLSFSTRRSCL